MSEDVEYEQPFEYPQNIHVRLHNDMRNCRLLAVIPSEREPENFNACDIRVQLLDEREPEWDEFYTVRVVDVQQMDRQMMQVLWRMQRAFDRMMKKPANPIMEQLMKHTRLEELRLG